jgi:hypothetical protein
MKPSSKFETFSETFQNRSEEIAGVEDGESDEHQVERVPHFLRRQNQARKTVALLIRTVMYLLFIQKKFKLKFQNRTRKTVHCFIFI